jgi:glycine cleavage system transcriptional repressor
METPHLTEFRKIDSPAFCFCYTSGMTKAIISGIGPDQPGIVAAIANILYKRGYSIIDSTMTRLAQEFAVILVISGPDNVRFADLQKEFATLEESHNMTVVIKPVPESLSLETQGPENPYMISVAGRDQVGITYRISRKLAEMNINITDLNAQCIPGENGPVYIMMIEVDIPNSIATSMVKEELQTVAQEIEMEIQLRPLEAVAL